jgi:hypothetical protein
MQRQIGKKENNFFVKINNDKDFYRKSFDITDDQIDDSSELMEVSLLTQILNNLNFKYEII